MVRNVLYLAKPNRADILPDIIFHGKQKLNQTAYKSSKEGDGYSAISLEATKMLWLQTSREMQTQSGS